MGKLHDRGQDVIYEPDEDEEAPAYIGPWSGLPDYFKTALANKQKELLSKDEDESDDDSSSQEDEE